MNPQIFDRCVADILLHQNMFWLPTKGTLLFDGNAKEAYEKAKEANDGELKVKNNAVTWKLLEGEEEEKEVLKKIIKAQQESRSRERSKHLIPSKRPIKYR